MKKNLIHILLGISIILIVFLGFNVYQYISYQHKNQLALNNAKEVEQEITNNKQILEKLNNNINSIKTEKSKKISEYEQWNKSNKEILEKIK
jgi:peptidoglycan hydrolase CwlO-like protein